MELAHQSDSETYRVIVLRGDGHEVLLERASKAYVLPSVEIPRGRRIAAELTSGMRNVLGYEVVCLFALSPTASSASKKRTHYYATELFRRAEECNWDGVWVQADSLAEGDFSDQRDCFAVRRTVHDCNGVSDAWARGPFERLGWFGELQRWVANAIEPRELHLTKAFSQLNASRFFSLIRFETNGPAVWFKAVGEPNLREFPITLALAQLWPRYVPTVIAARSDWHGWLSQEAEGISLAQTHEIELWKRTASELAELQVHTLGKTNTLLDLGVRDFRTNSLSEYVAPFFKVIGQVMEGQTKMQPPALSPEKLRLLTEQIRDALSANAALGIPDGLGHLDLNPENIILSANQCTFLDWAEAYAGPPFFSFQYVIEYFRRTVGRDSSMEAALADAYVGPWQRVVSRASIDGALIFNPLLATFAYAARILGCVNGPIDDDSQTAALLRSLARRMSREADCICQTAQAKH